MNQKYVDRINTTEGLEYEGPTAFKWLEITEMLSAYFFNKESHILEADHWSLTTVFTSH